MTTPLPVSDFTEIIEDYQQYLLLERNLSKLTLEAYLIDLQHLQQFLEEQGHSFFDVKYEDLLLFLGYLSDLGLAQKSIARVVSGVKSFYRFLEIEEILLENPTILLEKPAFNPHLPEVLTLEEIESIFETIDTTTTQGTRNATMLELLYSCGLRVSELCELTFSSIFLDEGFVRILGKGSKERLVPLSPLAIEWLKEYLPLRHEMTAKPGYAHYLFISRNHSRITRQMVFTIVKKLAKEAGIQKEISPHTFRHSFATHLLEGGANLQAIRDMLGHACISTTEIYTHIEKSQLRKEILLHHPRNQK